MVANATIAEHTTQIVRALGRPLPDGTRLGVGWLPTKQPQPPLLNSTIIPVADNPVTTEPQVDTFGKFLKPDKKSGVDRGLSPTTPSQTRNQGWTRATTNNSKHNGSNLGVHKERKTKRTRRVRPKEHNMTHSSEEHNVTLIRRA